jgi:multidrug transporter EmrE-like cation transporter
MGRFWYHRHAGGRLGAFGQRLNNKGWIGLLLLLAGMIMIKLA